MFLNFALSPIKEISLKMNRRLLTIILTVLFAVTACMTTKKQAVASSVALIPFLGPDRNINDQFEKEVYAAVKKMKGYNPVSVNTADIPIPYEIPARSLIGDYDYALTGELFRDSDEYWQLRLYLWKEKRLLFSDLVSGYDRQELAKSLPGMLEWLFSWTKRGAPRRESPAKNVTVSSVALVPFWGPDQNINDQFGAELFAAVGNMKDFQPVQIDDMTNLPDDVPKGGFPPYICPSPSLIKTNPYALTGELTRTDTGSWSLRLYLWDMAETRLVFTSTLTAHNMSEYRLLLPGLLEKLFSQI
jgi:hypothetical protein